MKDASLLFLVACIYGLHALLLNFTNLILFNRMLDTLKTCFQVCPMFQQHHLQLKLLIALVDMFNLMLKEIREYSECALVSYTFETVHTQCPRAFFSCSISKAFSHTAEWLESGPHLVILGSHITTSASEFLAILPFCG